MGKLLSTQPWISFKTITAILRILTGIFMIYHGFEIFSKGPIDTYEGWLTERDFPAPRAWALFGKGMEFTGGILLLLGLLTRLITVPLMLVMLFIVFVLGHGKIFYEDQYPFLFFILFLYLFLAGPGKWSLDHLVFKTQRK